MKRLERRSGMSSRNGDAAAVSLAVSPGLGKCHGGIERSNDRRGGVGAH